MTNDEMLTALSKRGFKLLEDYGLVFYGAIHFGNIFRYEDAVHLKHTCVCNDFFSRF